MLSAITSLIWGDEQDKSKDETSNVPDDMIVLENEWIFVQPKDQCKRGYLVRLGEDALSTAFESNDSVACGVDEGWLVEPPTCFNSNRGQLKKYEIGAMENLLIEHPSMSIYRESDPAAEDVGIESPHAEKAVVTSRGCSYIAVAGRLQKLDKRLPLKDLSLRTNSRRRLHSPKYMSRQNQVGACTAGTRARKQSGRMSGKHVGMVGKRGA